MNEREQKLYQTVGRLVRQVWIEWAKEQSDAKPSWLVPFDDLSFRDRDVDERIGISLRDFGLREAALICRNRAKAEIDYNFSQQGDFYAAPYLRAAENIEMALSGFFSEEGKR